MPATLSPAQRQLLTLFRRDLPDETWEDLRAVVGRFFAERAIAEADRVWDEKGWTDEDAERMLHAHYRRRSTPDDDPEADAPAAGDGR